MRATFTYLVGLNKGKRVVFDNSVVSIGRADDNALSFGETERRVSSHHAQVSRRGDQFVLLDLGSTNGTMVNGRRVVATEIHHDDLMEFGAGGPLVRFTIEGNTDQPESSNAEPDLKRLSEKHHQDSSSQNSALRKTRDRRSNIALVFALVAAMSIGALAGIFASPSLRPRDEELTFAEMAELNSAAVVLVRTEFETLGNAGQPLAVEAATGSGLVISSNGLIVTNRHLVRPWEYDSSIFSGRNVRIEIIFEGQTRVDAVLAEIYKIPEDKYPDVAVLKINRTGLAAVRGFEDQLDRVNQGDEIAVIGYPLGLDLMALTRDARIEPSLATGIVSRVGHDAIQLSLRANHGNSGGPVLNRRGEVIGIVTANVGGAPDMTLCTPIRAALELIKDR